jgi:hypothetical protein
LHGGIKDTDWSDIVDNRNLIDLAVELASRENISVRNLTITVETDSEIRDIVVTDNDDLFRPLHIGELGFYNFAELLDYLEQ